MTNKTPNYRLAQSAPGEIVIAIHGGVPEGLTDTLNNSAASSLPKEMRLAPKQPSKNGSHLGDMLRAVNFWTLYPSFASFE